MLSHPAPPHHHHHHPQQGSRCPPVLRLQDFDDYTPAHLRSRIEAEKASGTGVRERSTNGLKRFRAEQHVCGDAARACYES